MARQTLTPQQQAHMILFKILRAHNNLYNRTEGVVGPELVRQAANYVRRTKREYTAIGDEISEMDRRLIDASIKYWSSQIQYHSRLH